jgi:hypothetical protein
VQLKSASQVIQRNGDDAYWAKLMGWVGVTSIMAIQGMVVRAAGGAGFETGVAGLVWRRAMFANAPRQIKIATSMLIGVKYLVLLPTGGLVALAEGRKTG